MHSLGSFPLTLLVDALAGDRTCYILGAGASAPHVPTMAQLPERIASYAPRLGSFAVSVPDSPVRRLLGPVIEEALTTTTLDRWKAGTMTTATISLVVQDIIAAAHLIPMAQYEVFQLVPPTSTIVSFNWDGLARSRCRQEVICPHGMLRPRLHTPLDLDELLDRTQLYDSQDARDWLIPDLVMPGEEASAHLGRTRERVLRAWLEATHVVVIGYSFGIGSKLAYDRVWLDAFVEALQHNYQAAIHVIAPDAENLRGELVERLRRAVNIHAWPVSWYALSLALLQTAERHGCATAAELMPYSRDVETACHEVAYGRAAAV